MKYVGLYWSLFAPKIKKSIKKRFGNDLAEKSIENGKAEYRRLLSEADDLGKGNPMAMNAYFAYVFAAAWLGSEREITPDEMALVMTNVLTSQPLKFYFGLTDINKPKGEKKWERDMKKYQAWYEKNNEKYPVNWVVNFDENKHKQGSYYYFSRCPICEFCQRAGLAELMPALCATDEIMFRLQHGVLHREHTIAAGDAVCDYWIVGDKIKNPR
ncbi:MAG: L-2-amino-thiazoline-4-carboxylic acid hydrolase [Clostridia bacterium]|nr:L-2-amino-thiazoline-4-carboxylic acid hydrolase [Clostridia bacterium]